MRRWLPKRCRLRQRSLPLHRSRGGLRGTGGCAAFSNDTPDAGWRFIAVYLEQPTRLPWVKAFIELAAERVPPPGPGG